MSLIVKVSVNDGPAIAILAAQRIAGGEAADDQNTYLVQGWSRLGDAESWSPALEDTTVGHLYGDGALELLKKIVAQLP